MYASGYSFRLLSKKKTEKARQNPELKEKERVSHDTESDSNKRSFLKLAGVVGVGALATTLIPKKAEALVFGSSPTSSVVGLKDHNNTRIDPAQETGGNLATIATNIPVKGQATMANSMPIVIASNQTPIAVTGTFTGASAVNLEDSNNNIINPATDDSIVYLRRMVKLMESQAAVDSGNRQRITLDSIGTGTAITTSIPVTVSGTVTTSLASTTVTSISAGTNVIGGVTIDGQGRQMFTEIARQAYNGGIRTSLIFS